MNPAQTINAGVSTGLDQTFHPAQAARPVAPSAGRRKKLVLGLLAVASCAAVVLVLKTAAVTNDLLVSVDSAFNGMSH